MKKGSKETAVPYCFLHRATHAFLVMPYHIHVLIRAYPFYRVFFVDKINWWQSGSFPTYRRMHTTVSAVTGIIYSFYLSASFSRKSQGVTSVESAGLLLECVFSIMRLLSNVLLSAPEKLLCCINC